MRFLTAVALALVMLWVPVDGVAQQAINLRELIVVSQERPSLYLHPGTRQPYTGPVVHAYNGFSGPEWGRGTFRGSTAGLSGEASDEKNPAIQPRFTCEGGGDRASCIFGVALPGML